MTIPTTLVIGAISAAILAVSCASQAPPTGVVALDTTAPLQSATPSSTSDSLEQAIIPIPPGVAYQGISTNTYDGYAAISFSAGKGVYPTASGATSYGAFLGELGWKRCVGEPGCEPVNVTDTAFVGVFRHGTDLESPTIVIGINQMVSPDEWTTLFVKNCRSIEETQGSRNSNADCVIVLPVEDSAHP